MLASYPTEFPTEALTMVLDCVRGHAVPIPELTNAAWNVIGYGLGQVMPGGPMVAGINPIPEATDEELLVYTIENGVPPPADNGIVQGIIPWSSIVMLAIKLILKLQANN
jgi:hypothetical protein